MKKLIFITFITTCFISGIKSQETNNPFDSPIEKKKSEKGLDKRIVKTVESLFDYTAWYRRDLNCSSTINNKTTDNGFVGYIYLKHKEGDTYTALIPFWLEKNQDNSVTTDIFIDILDVDYPKPFNAELIDCLTGKIQNINFQVDDYKVVFKNITATNYPKIIRFDALMTRGYLKGKEPKTEEEKVKTARTIRRIKQKTDSWSPLAENQIIAQPTTIRPIVSHGGYHQFGNKRAVIWTNNKKLSGYFEIINQNNNRQHPATQPVVYRGKLKNAGFHIWGGNNLIADFSNFNELGFYKIRLVFDQNEREITDSYSFAIKPALYVDLAQKSSEFLYYQRCGMEISGWHKACHTDDAVILPDGQRIDASGGWHSAGDLNKWIGPAHFAVRGLTTLFETFPEKFAADQRNGIPKLIDEAKTKKQSHIDIHYLALYEYLIMNPETPFKDDIINVFANYINYIKPVIDMSPFGQVGRYTKDGGISNIPGRSTTFAKNAWVLATAAILLDKPEYVDIAERQLQWITGFNPVDISMLTGVGKNSRCCHHRYCFIEGHEDGKIPGAILNGISAGTGKLFNLGDYNTRNFVISDKLPVDYPVFDNDVYGWTWAYHNGETRNFTSGWFMLAAAQVEKALMEHKLR